MKERLLRNWNIGRVLYVLVGGAVITQSILQHEWWGALIGVYFSAMGLLGYGCAGGSCRR